MRRFKSKARQGGFVMIQHRKKAGPDIDHQVCTIGLREIIQDTLVGRNHITY